MAMCAEATKFTLDSIVHPDMHVIAKHLECAVCLHMVVDPMQTACGHIFCKACLRQVVVCPSCRESVMSVESKPLNECNKPMMRMIHNLKVRCPHHSLSQSPAEGQPEAKRPRVEAEKCEWEGTYSDLLAKHMLECEQHVVSCPRGCGETMRRKNLAAHALLCVNTFEKCPICGALVKPDQMVAHHNDAAVVHVQILETKLQEKDAMAEQALVLADIRSRLTQLEAGLEEMKKLQQSAQSKFCWQIPNIAMLKLMYPKSKALTSPPFLLQGIRFYFEFYPCGTHNSPEDKCALFLRSDAAEGHELEITVSINGKNPHPLKHSGWKKGWGKENLWAIPSGSEPVDIEAELVSCRQFVQHSW